MNNWLDAIFLILLNIALFIYMLHLIAKNEDK